MRIGLMIGPEKGHYREKVAKLIEAAVAAEQAGFASIWVPQIPNDFDAMTAVALMGQATTRVEIGTAVGLRPRRCSGPIDRLPGDERYAAPIRLAR